MQTPRKLSLHFPVTGAENIFQKTQSQKLSYFNYFYFTSYQQLTAHLRKTQKTWFGIDPSFATLKPERKAQCERPSQLGFSLFQRSFVPMSNRAERRAAARLALKAAAVQANPAVMTATTAAAGSGFTPNVDFSEPEQSQKRPVSDAQFAANRANAQKSTGPTSTEGKARSSMNAVKTGLTGQTVLLPTDDAIAYQAHLDRHFHRYSPVDDQEHTLVQFIADSEWRLLRIAPLEASIYAIGRLENPDLFPDEKDPVAREALIRGKLFLLYRRELNNLALQERRLRNQQTTDLAKLDALQKERKEKEKTAATERRRSMNQACMALRNARANDLAFNPADFGFEFSIEEIDHFNAVAHTHKQISGSLPDVEKVLAAFHNLKKEAA